MGNGNNNKNLLPTTFIDTKREHFSPRTFSTPRSINFWRNSGKSVLLPYSKKRSPSQGRNLIYANNHTIFTISHLRGCQSVSQSCARYSWPPSMSFLPSIVAGPALAECWIIYHSMHSMRSGGVLLGILETPVSIVVSRSLFFWHKTTAPRRHRPDGGVD